jgi:fused signal recognition particle receptor
MSFWKKLVSKFIPKSGEPVDWEALLLEADFGLALTEKFAHQLAKEGFGRDMEGGQKWLREHLITMLRVPALPFVADKPEVILLIGVNGSGKTTTAARLAALAQKQNKSVMFAAADTFRAAAVDQIQIWGERLKAPVITGPEGSDPASVAFQAHERAQKEGMDLLIVDTAGRQANKNNLMLELQKIKRTLQKKNDKAPHHTWLVVDANTGNNILAQAREFHEAVGLTGMIMTKLDGSGKGGMIAAVREELKLPTFYLGCGESLESLTPFDAQQFVVEFFSA